MECNAAFKNIFKGVLMILGKAHIVKKFFKFYSPCNIFVYNLNSVKYTRKCSVSSFGWQDPEWLFFPIYFLFYFVQVFISEYGLNTHPFIEKCISEGSLDSGSQSFVYLNPEENNWGLSEYKFLYSSNFLISILNTSAIIEPVSRIIGQLFGNHCKCECKGTQRKWIRGSEVRWYPICRRWYSSMCISQPLSFSKEMFVLLKDHGIIWSLYLRWLAFTIHHGFWIIATFLTLSPNCTTTGGNFRNCSTPWSAYARHLGELLSRNHFWHSIRLGGAPWGRRGPEFHTSSCCTELLTSLLPSNLIIHWAELFRLARNWNKNQ